MWIFSGDMSEAGEVLEFQRLGRMTLRLSEVRFEPESCISVLPPACIEILEYEKESLGVGSFSGIRAFDLVV